MKSSKSLDFHLKKTVQLIQLFFKYVDNCIVCIGFVFVQTNAQQKTPPHPILCIYINIFDENALVHKLMGINWQNYRFIKTGVHIIQVDFGL